MHYQERINTMDLLVLKLPKADFPLQPSSICRLFKVLLASFLPLRLLSSNCGKWLYLLIWQTYTSHFFLCAQLYESWISLEGQMLKLKLQYFGHLMRRAWWWERLKAEGEGGDRGWDGGMVSPSQWTWVWANTGRWWRTGSLRCSSSWGPKESDMTEQPKNKHYYSCLTNVNPQTTMLFIIYTVINH